MFKIMNTPASKASNQLDFTNAVNSRLPKTCAGLKELLRVDDGKLFANRINYNREPIISSTVSGLAYTVIIGNSLVSTDKLFQNFARDEKIKHDMKELDSSLCIAVRRSLGTHSVQSGDFNHDMVEIRITAVDEFVSSLSKGSKTGSASLYSCGALLTSKLTDEKLVCSAINHIKDLNGTFTPQSLIESLRGFNFESQPKAGMEKTIKM